MKNEIPDSFDGLIEWWTHATLDTLPPESIKLDILTYLKWLRWQNERIEQLEKALERFADKKIWVVDTWKDDILMCWNETKQGDPQKFAKNALEGKEE